MVDGDVLICFFLPSSMIYSCICDKHLKIFSPVRGRRLWQQNILDWGRNMIWSHYKLF